MDHEYSIMSGHVRPISVLVWRFVRSLLKIIMHTALKSLYIEKRDLNYHADIVPYLGPCVVEGGLLSCCRLWTVLDAEWHDLICPCLLPPWHTACQDSHCDAQYICPYLGHGVCGCNASCCWGVGGGGMNNGWAIDRAVHSGWMNDGVAIIRCRWTWCWKMVAGGTPWQASSNWYTKLLIMGVYGMHLCCVGLL